MLIDGLKDVPENLLEEFILEMPDLEPLEADLLFRISGNLRHHPFNDEEEKKEIEKTSYNPFRYIARRISMFKKKFLNILDLLNILKIKEDIEEPKFRILKYLTDTQNYNSAML